MKKQLKQLPVSVIVPMKNSETTVIETLRTLAEQTYPIAEIIVIDNASSDNSVALVKTFKKKSKIPILLIERKENKGVGASYNLGVKKTKSFLIVLMHSDSSLPTKFEMEKLVTPFLKEQKIVATFPTGILPKKIWESYGFWEKCLFARSVEKDDPGFNGKFDCVRKDAYLTVGGFDDVHYGEDIGIGGEDADLYLRLEKIGTVKLSSARIIHLHYMGTAYKFSDWIRNRKLLARTYGRVIRLQGLNLPLRPSGIGLYIPLGILIFLVKPFLAVLPFIPNMFLIGIGIFIVYTFLNSRTLYTHVSTITNPRILLLPFIDIFLIYFETFWMLEAFLMLSKKYSIIKK